MTLSILSNTTPSAVCLVPLPNSAKAVHLTFTTNERRDGERYVTDELLHLQTWLDIKLKDEESLAEEEESSDEFIERCCDGCEHYYDSETSEFGHDLRVNGESVYVTEVTHNSPCPCYTDGLGSVDFPCLAGEEPQGGSGVINYRHLKAGVMLHAAPGFGLDTYLWPRNSAYTMQIQAYRDGDVSAATLPVNVYDDLAVCWGSENTDPASLVEAVSQYLESPPNNDLASVPTHNQRIEMVSDAALRAPSGVVLSIPEPIRPVSDWDQLEEETKIPPQRAVALACSELRSQFSYLRLSSSPHAVHINGNEHSYVALVVERQRVDDGKGNSVEVFRDAKAAATEHAICVLSPTNPELAAQLIGHAPLYQSESPCSTTASSSAPAELAHT